MHQSEVTEGEVGSTTSQAPAHILLTHTRGRTPLSHSHTFHQCVSHLTLSHIKQVLEDVAECPAPLLQPCLQQVLEMCMVVATNKAFAPSTREQALALLHWMAK